jgi:prepilin-type processing-associated H-X9-DG protein
MEPKIIRYLKRIIKTLSIGLIWMIINARLGISSNYAFVDGNIKTSNIVFYIWFVISLAAMIFYLYKLWKDDLNFDEE